MIRISLFLAVCLFSCKQVKKTSEYHFAENKAALKQPFLLKKDSAAFSSQEMWTSLLIGHLFDKNQKDAVLRYVENDSIVQIIVLRQSGQKWDTLFSTKIHQPLTYYYEDFVDLRDFDGDNIPDLKIVKEYWETHQGERSDLWLYKQNHFTKVEGFDRIVSAEYDKHTDLIYSYQSIGCADMNMYFGVFKLTGNTITTIKEMSCDCCTETGNSCTISINGQKPYKVPYRFAYKHVPAFYADFVKEKCVRIKN